MAEPRTSIIPQSPAVILPLLVGVREQTLPTPRVPAPVWRSLLSPTAGQRALVLGEPGKSLLHLLQEFGVRVERAIPSPRNVNGGFDFILEERTGWGSSLKRKNVASLLAPKGRWIIALHGSRAVGFRSRWVLHGLRGSGFRNVETFYAHDSLWTPQILVPLERPEPFEFFLRLTVGGGGIRRRAILLAFQVLGHLGLHRGLLPNCIVIARRS